MDNRTFNEVFGLKEALVKLELDADADNDYNVDTPWNGNAKKKKETVMEYLRYQILNIEKR